MAQARKSEDANKPAGKVRYWLTEIDDAKKRDKRYRKEGQRIVDIYSGRMADKIPFNILYSNTETLMPALYSSTPKPVVQRRFRDDDPLGKAAAMAGQRCLEFLMDTNIEEYETFDQAMTAATLDGLLPGRGCTRIKYEAEVADVPEAAYGAPAKDATAETEMAAVPSDEGSESPAASPTVPTKAWEMVCTETIAWDRILFGFAKRWAKMPWIGFEHFLDREESTRLFGAGKVAHLVFTKGNKKAEDEWDGPRKADRDNDGGERKTCLVYEIWDRKKKRVLFVSPVWQGDYLKSEDDPLELSGFFPIPRPVQFLLKNNDLEPTALYTLYENQAKELNTISVRINRIVAAMKVRGVYDGSLGDTLNDLLKADDNALVPTANASNIALEGGLDKYIWMMPLAMLQAVLKELIVSRDQCKQIIYEITGIADILRGTTDANETLGAQQIKNQWASMRIKMMQNEVRRYVREALRIMLEVAARKFSPDTFAQMTGLPYVMQAEKDQAQQLLMAVQQEAQGQPIPPQLQQTLAKAQETLQNPAWEDVLKLLNNDIERAYRIDVETNSTIEINEQEDKQNISEAMGAMAQFVEAVTPMVQAGVMPFEAAKSMLLSIVRRFRFGTEVEEEIKTMQPPQQKPDEEQAKKEADAHKQMIDAAAKEKQLADQLAGEKMARENDRRSAELGAREEKVRHDEEMLALRQEFDRYCKASDKANSDREASVREDKAKGIERQASERVKQAGDMVKKTEAPMQAAQMLQKVMQGMQASQDTQTQTLAQMIERLTEEMQKDTVPERDPKTNRVIRLRKEARPLPATVN